ncbi:hypothetical protein NQ314_000732 [Rhamnusium bicolor]|uniref:C2H2-type domain-containing protein n=1 Tax=Rhamnusium bicolor TaxID=1586634 RepID=A0AAV8ZWB7_9CUCU|nr:hypothetical protein NQ314_000732 [Rhamnusium bicolor]
MFLHQTSKIRHEKSHEADPEHKFVCPICWKRTKTKEELDLHIKEHNNRPKRHTCKVCGEAFCRRMLLDNHVLLNHTNEEEISKKEKEIIVYGLIEATKQL